MAEVKFNESIDLTVNRVSKKNSTTNTNESRKNNRDNKNNKKGPKQPYVRSFEEVQAGLVKSLENVGGKYIKFDDIDHTEGLLVAAVLKTDVPGDVNALAFAIINKDCKVAYISHNEHFTVQRDVPANLSVLDYLYTNEPEYIDEVAKGALSEDNVDVFTKVYVNVPKVSNKANNKKGNSKGGNKRSNKKPSNK